MYIFADGSFVAKYRSNDVKKTPFPSTVNDCANGSLWGAFISTLTSVGFAVGWGGFLTETRLVSWVKIVPDPLYVPSASLANTVDPGRGVTPGGTAVTFTVFIPLVILTCGGGFEFGSLKKKLATISPQLSDINSDLVILAVAPLVSPTIVAPGATYP